MNRTIAVTIAVVIAVLTAVCLFTFRGDHSPLSNLAEAADGLSHRPFEPRLAGPFPYARYTSPSRGNGDSDASLLRLRAEAGQHTRSDDPRVAGVASLFAGETERSVELLRSAAARTKKPDAWSDLSAALLVLSNDRDLMTPALDALVAAGEALRISPTNAAAMFNRALALQRLGLLDDARTAWNRYREIDASSPWAREAADAVARLDGEMRDAGQWRTDRLLLENAIRRRDIAETRRLVKRYPRDARAWGEGMYPAMWAEATQRGDMGAANAQLELARAIGDVLRESSGELLLSDAVRVIDENSGKLGVRALLVRAYLAYRAGRMDHASNAPTALGRLREASDLFTRAGSPMRWVASYYAGSVLYGKQHIDEARVVLDQLSARHFEDRGYVALAAQIGWERGLATLASGSSSDALEIFEASAAAFERAGDRLNSAVLRDFAAMVLDLAGDVEAAWRARRAIFIELAREGGAQRTITALGTATTAMLRRQEWTRARPLLDLVVDAAVRENDAMRTSLGLAQRSAVLAALGDGPGARRDLADLRARLAMIASADVRDALLLDARYAEALLLRDSNPAGAIEHLTLALDNLDRSGRAMFHSRVYLERARMYKRIGNRDAARADVVAGLASIEKYRDAIADPQLRAMAGVSADELIQEGIALALESGDREQALDLSEKARARSLLESFHGRTSGVATSPLSLAEIRQAITSHAAIVEFAIVHDRLVTFVIKQSGLQVVETPAPREQLAEIVAATQNPETLRPLERAWTLFIQPITEQLADVEHLAIVPDRRLGGVPFAALFDARRKRFLLDDATVTIAPSASLAVLCSRRAVHANGMFALSVGANEFDRKRFAELEPLPSVLDEARAVASVYGDARLVTGAKATRAEVTAAFLHADIVHFAGHAIAPRYDSSASALLVAPDGRDATLTALDIARMHLEKTRLVVLSACRSAVAGDVGDGVENLATAFLVAGAPSVVGSSWDIDDREAADLALRFHREYRIDRDAARAFRDAARAYSSNSTNAVPRWAVVTPFGGSPVLVKEGERVK